MVIDWHRRVVGAALVCALLGTGWWTCPAAAAGPSFAPLAARARPAVIQVRGRIAGPGGGSAHGAGSLSIGTGFFINRDGYALTNEHVVHGVSDLRVRLYDGRELPGCVVGWDEPTDVALLKVNPPQPVPALRLGDSDSVRVGDAAVVIGNPFGFNHSVTAGIISAKERVVERTVSRREPAAAAESYSFFIQTDASINLGNSGGPLLDTAGNVVGVSSAFWGSQQPAQGIGFAIPINVVKLLLPSLRQHGQVLRSYLGVESQAVDPALAEAFGLTSTRGALIASVEVGSAAEAAALDPGDIVLSWNGRALATVEDFKIFAQLTPPGSAIALTLLRDGRSQSIHLVTRPGPAPSESPHSAGCASELRSSPMSLGLEVADLTPGQAVTLPGGRGVVVKQAEEGAAREAGLNAGDIFLRVGKKWVGSVAELESALKATQGTVTPLLMRRDGADFWTALPRRR